MSQNITSGVIPLNNKEISKGPNFYNFKTKPTKIYGQHYLHFIINFMLTKFNLDKVGVFV